MSSNEKYLNQYPSSLFMKALWMIAAVLVFSNVYTLNLLYQAKTDGQYASINSQVMYSDSVNTFKRRHDSTRQYPCTKPHTLVHAT